MRLAACYAGMLSSSNGGAPVFVLFSKARVLFVVVGDTKTAGNAIQRSIHATTVASDHMTTAILLSHVVVSVSLG